MQKHMTNSKIRHEKCGQNKRIYFQMSKACASILFIHKLQILANVRKGHLYKHSQNN